MGAFVSVRVWAGGPTEAMGNGVRTVGNSVQTWLCDSSVTATASRSKPGQACKFWHFTSRTRQALVFEITPRVVGTLVSAAVIRATQEAVECREGLILERRVVVMWSLPIGLSLGCGWHFDQRAQGLCLLEGRESLEIDGKARDVMFFPAPGEKEHLAPSRLGSVERRLSG